MLAGQHNLLGRMSVVTDSIYKISGKYPGLWGGDFGFADSTHDIDNIAYRPLLVGEVKKQYARGSVISMSYHQASPAVGEPCQFMGGVVTNLTEEQWNDLLTEGTPMYEAWRMQMDLLASYLVQLRDANIPILFRPYHEMNGNWFWWGKKTGENGYVELWKQLYHYYTEVHQLNNLLWVWSPDKPWHGLKEYYPGNEYLDMIGVDIYPEKDTNVVYRQDWYDQILEIADGMPIALTEGMVLPSEYVLNEQPDYTWFMGWGDLIYRNNINTTQDISDFYNHEKVFTADEVKEMMTK